MPSIPMLGTVLVSIVSALVRVSPSAWHLKYDVRNTGQVVIWLVVDESLVLRRDNAKIELSYAREKMKPGVQVFGYFDPKVVKIPPGGSLRRVGADTLHCPHVGLCDSEPQTTAPRG